VLPLEALVDQFSRRLGRVFPALALAGEGKAGKK